MKEAKSIILCNTSPDFSTYLQPPINLNPGVKHETALVGLA